ncbi:pyridoxamine 5'-phosphate oxidase family protein [Microscilla marina]|uniref:Pyridoxamine 5'-phosphate oxidase family n=1 Tax=Microscilla marina ATCC 23134 TaxID=313606 RepID=A1ZZP5_MICM2|nr:pyridoxamine 5'-phosphate oxidase family protein [Microscilla marina]EAY24153.1 pyridoxamine 5'-phosphate oxidase family [Microscilla marina ATCC 23134]
MGKMFEQIQEAHMDFIAQQKMFFVATAGDDTSVNLSPKGMDSFKVVDTQKVVWLNLTGSGNETAAHLLENNRMTIMFCAFEGNPLILRLYGTAKALYKGDEKWNNYIKIFGNPMGARQIFEVAIQRVQTSCGFGVPLYQYDQQRTLLPQWAEKKGPDGINEYWEKKNMQTIDGKPTGMKT